MSTRAYVDLMFAWGHARLGDAKTARRLTAEAAERLHPAADAANQNPRVDPVHAWLLDAFSFRIEQVIAGAPHRGPWPAELLSRLADLDDRIGSLGIPKYGVDRMRAASRILEPNGQVDPYAPWKNARRHSENLNQLLKTTRPDQWADKLREFCDRVDADPDVLDRLDAYHTLLEHEDVSAVNCGSELAERVRAACVSALEQRWADDPGVPAMFTQHRPTPADHHDERWQAEYEADAADPGSWVERSVYVHATWLHDVILELASRRKWRDLVAALADDVLRVPGSGAPGGRYLDDRRRKIPNVLIRLGMRAEAQRFSDERREFELADYRNSPNGDLLVCLAIAGIDLWLGRPERAAEAFDFACNDMGKLRHPALAALTICAYLEILEYLDWPAGHGRLNAVVSVLPIIPDMMTTRMWYSRLHVEVVDRLVLAVALPKFTSSDRARVPTTELGSRREALLDLRARLVEWVERYLGPHAAHSDRARPGHADHP